jgi:pyridinium-3,5-bisthiocarboxylic acid mononucleotide nickel chelatase
MNLLFEAGADDVYFQPIIMKKTRPATMLSVICSKETSSAMEHIILSETTSLGLRKYGITKRMLTREWETLETIWGSIRMKHAKYKGKIIKSKPEYEDCLKIAQVNKITLADVYREITRITSDKSHGTR